MAPGEHLPVQLDEGLAQPPAVIGLRIYVELCPDRLVRNHLPEEEQVGRHQADFVYGIIPSFSPGKPQGAGHSLAAADAEYVIAVILIRGAGAFLVAEYQMPVRLELHLQHGQGEPFSVFDDFPQLSLLSLKDMVRPEAEGNPQVLLPKLFVKTPLGDEKEVGDKADSQ